MAPRRLFGDQSDEAWRWFAEHDPSYGVLSAPEYHRGNLTPERLASFFESGVRHVTHVLDIISKHFEGLVADRCLDFGCGVGRLLIPFAAHFSRVTGVDISTSRRQ